MEKSFQSSHTRIGWAKKNIAQFEKRAEGFFQRTPYALIAEPDTDGVSEFHKFRLAKQLPLVLTERTVSASEHLRSALDLAAVAVGRLCNAPDLDDIHFPFSKTGTDFKSRINSAACKYLPDEIKALFSSFQPYKGGNDLLWAVNELCNTSKHRVILRVALQSGVSIRYLETSDAVHAPIEIMEGLHDCAENEVVFARTQRGLKWKYRLQIAFGVAFGKVEALEGKPVYPTLRAMLEIVTDIVASTEAECRRIGLL